MRALSSLVTICEAEAGVCWVRGRLVRTAEAGLRLHVVRVTRPRLSSLVEMYETMLTLERS